jgi:hypothetical protein
LAKLEHEELIQKFAVLEKGMKRFDLGDVFHKNFWNVLERVELDEIHKTNNMNRGRAN